MHVLGGVLGSWNSSTASRYSICSALMLSHEEPPGELARHNHTGGKGHHRAVPASRRRIAGTSRTGSFRVSLHLVFGQFYLARQRITRYKDA